MAQHKWHKEIKAWADGAEIEMKYDFMCGWNVDPNPDWDTDLGIFRIKPQEQQSGCCCKQTCSASKKPQYLYVYHGKKSDGEMGIWFEKQRVPYIESGYIGKIKLEQDDE